MKLDSIKFHNIKLDYMKLHQIIEDQIPLDQIRFFSIGSDKVSLHNNLDEVRISWGILEYIFNEKEESII